VNPAAQPGRLDIASLLDRYAAGQHDDTVKRVTGLSQPQARAVRSALVSTGHRWIHDKPDDLSFRILTAASFALEFEIARAEKGDWLSFNTPEQCTGRCGIEWACTILQARGPADAAERTWHHATFALLGGVRDWSFLLSPLSPPTPRTRFTGHVLHVQHRLPDDPRVRLTRGIAIASRHIVADEMDIPRASARTSTAMPARRPVMAGPIAARLSTSLEYAVQQFTPLVDDPVVGAEARMRLGYLYWRGGHDEQAYVAERLAAQATTDVALRYNSSFIAATAAQSAGDLTAAEEMYRQALETRPHSQSATIALAGLLFLRGDAAAGYEAIERSRAERPNDDDPWRMFLYGDYLRLPAHVVQLRKQITR
jgi:hypothetical protein